MHGEMYNERVGFFLAFTSRYDNLDMQLLID